MDPRNTADYHLARARELGDVVEFEAVEETAEFDAALLRNLRSGTVDYRPQPGPQARFWEEPW